MAPPASSSHPGSTAGFYPYFVPFWNQGPLQQLLGQQSWGKHRLSALCVSQELLGQGWSQAVLHHPTLQSRGFQEVN